MHERPAGRRNDEYPRFYPIDAACQFRRWNGKAFQPACTGGSAGDAGSAAAARVAVPLGQDDVGFA